jgi:DNA-binding CsgD family transcriptional regulator
MITVSPASFPAAAPAARHLTRETLTRLLDALYQIYVPVRSAQFPQLISQALRTLIPGALHGACVSTKHPITGLETRLSHLSPRPTRWEQLSEAFTRNIQQFPLLSYRTIKRIGDAAAVSDFADWHQFKRLDLYDQYYRELGIEDDLSINFWTPKQRVCVCVLRERRGFSTEERAVFNALRPHLEQAYRSIAAYETLRKTQAVAATLPFTGPSAASAGAMSSSGWPEPAQGATALRKLGLSTREAQVLYWVACGKTSPEVAMILGIRPNTVRTHLKVIFNTLGVENRLSASLQALEVLGLPASATSEQALAAA